jgi:peroxiredoxin
MMSVKNKIMFLSDVLTVLPGCNRQPKYAITGSLDDIQEGTVFLEQRVGNEVIVVDSALISNGRFRLSGSVAVPDMYFMRIAERRGRLILFVENSKISISGHGDSLYLAEVKGSSVQDELDAFNVGYDRINDKIRTLSGEYRLASQANDQERMAALTAEYMELDSLLKEKQATYVSSHPASYISPYLLLNMSYNMKVDEMEHWLTGLDERLAESQIVRDLWEMVTILKSVEVGRIAPDFTLPDPQGVPVTLSDLRGKVLLVDFWAAWCGPCRRENPNVVEAYSKYHDKGFDVLGVSLDDSREDWLQAVEDDMLTWTQVSDLKGWANAAAIQYGIQGIPANILLDRDGRIIDKNLRGERLHTRLAELLD